MTSERDEDSIRITQQFLARDAMVYDLRSGAGRLTGGLETRLRSNDD